MSVFYQVDDQSITVSGKTFIHKEAIKALGARFQGQNKTWVIKKSEEALEGIQKLCESTGGGPLGAITAPKVERPPLSFELGTPTPVNPTAQNSDSYSVSQLVSTVEQAIKNCFPKTVWVTGEIQSLNFRKNSAFFQLADKKEGASTSATMTLNATIWNNRLQAMIKRHGQDVIKEVLGEGLSGRFLCQVTLYKDRGFLSLNIADLDPDFTKGALALAREKLLRELRSQGLDRLNKSKPLPLFPLRIGLISADGSRAKSDFIDQLWSYKYPGEVLFRSTQMQGEYVLPEVVKAIRELDQASCDVIIVTRGGGSAADLRWFDSKEIALSIAHAKTPIIAAIGHHDDVCIAEEVAFRREKTPTAAADFIIHHIQSTREYIDKLHQSLLGSLRQRVDTLVAIQSTLAEKLKRHAESGLHSRGEQIQRLLNQLRQEASETLEGHRRNAVSTAHRLQQLVQARWAKSFQLCQQLAHQLEKGSTQSLGRHESRLQSEFQRITWQARESLQNTSKQQTSLEGRYQLAIVEATNQKTKQLADMRSKLDQTNPKPWLKKGWTRLDHQDGPLTSVKKVKKGQIVKARVEDGLISMKVEQTKNFKHN